VGSIALAGTCNPKAQFVVYPGAERFTVARGIEAISASGLAREIG
jgi:hypothetical protein